MLQILQKYKKAADLRQPFFIIYVMSSYDFMIPKKLSENPR